MTLKPFMETIKFTEENKQTYIDFVTAHPSGSFLQSWSWGDYQTSQGKQAVRYGLFNEGELVGTVQLLKIKVPHFSGYYLYAPYGPVLNNREDAASLIDQVKKDFPEVWFIRLEPKQELDISGSTTQRIQPGKTLIVNLNQPAEELLNAMHPKTRYNIKVAAKHTVLVSHSKEASTAVLDLFVETGKRQNYRNHPAKYYQDLIDFLSNSSDCQALVYQAMYNDSLVAAAIMIDHGNNRTYLFGGSHDEYRNVMAPYALHWQAIQDAKALNFTEYDWWGIETSTGKQAGFVQFKLRWGGDEVVYPKAFDIVQHRTWYTIYTIFRKLNRLF